MGKRKMAGGTKTKEWGLVASFSGRATTMCATGEPLACRLLLAKQRRDGLASSRRPGTNEELLAPVGRSSPLTVLTSGDFPMLKGQAVENHTGLVCRLTVDLKHCCVMFLHTPKKKFHHINKNDHALADHTQRYCLPMGCSSSHAHIASLCSNGKLPSLAIARGKGRRK